MADVLAYTKYMMAFQGFPHQWDVDRTEPNGRVERTSRASDQTITEVVVEGPLGLFVCFIDLDFGMYHQQRD